MWLGAAFVACSHSSGDRTIVGAADPRLAKEPVPPDLVAANTRFAFKLYRQVLAEDADTNVFISPASVSIALAMTYNGADGTTKEAMAQTLELGGMSLDDVNEANLILLSNLAYADDKVHLALANSLWSRENMPFYPDFLDRNRTYFGAQVTNLDFADPKSVDVVNGWVSRNTNGKIPKIVDAIPPEMILYLINAIWFKGEWNEKFDQTATRDEPFHLLGGPTKTVPMMHQTRTYNYYEGPGFQAASLPYGQEGRFSMYVFLPSTSSSLAAFHDSLTSENWDTWMASFHSMEGNIGLPRFEIDYEKTLNGALKAAGMAVAFDRDRADFSKMLPVSPEANAYISEVKHKTYVKVNEEGTEAAAVTSVGIGVTSVTIPPERFTMIVDRPFFLVIRDNVSGTILFMGCIVDPA
jgi:serpin B